MISLSWSHSWVDIGMQGFCYVKYSSPEIATAVIENLDGIEYPQGSGLRLKVCPPLIPHKHI